MCIMVQYLFNLRLNRVNFFHKNSQRGRDKTRAGGQRKGTKLSLSVSVCVIPVEGCGEGGKGEGCQGGSVTVLVWQKNASVQCVHGNTKDSLNKTFTLLTKTTFLYSSSVSFVHPLAPKLLILSIWGKDRRGKVMAVASLHKVRTYKEYHSVCPSSELGLSQPLSRQRVFPSPQKQGGGGTLACGWGVGGSPNSDEGHTLWYSLYVRTLCVALNKSIPILP
jgi:hypothetical protein